MEAVKKFGVVVAATISLVGFGLVSATSADAATVAPKARKQLTCQGKKATIVGRGGTVRGTAKRDVIVLIRASKVLAGAGNDLICGSGGNDEIHGGKGNDRILGNAGNDDLFGEAGNDSVSGGAGDDSIEGGSGRDRCNGGSGLDDIDGIDDHGNHVEPGDDHGVHAPGTDDHGVHAPGTDDHGSGHS
mgnify:CR=1 FL=1